MRWLVFDGEALAHLDATGAGALGDLIRSLQAEGVTFVFAALVGGDHLYPTVRADVEAAAPAPGSPSAGDGRPPSETGR